MALDNKPDQNSPQDEPPSVFSGPDSQARILELAGNKATNGTVAGVAGAGLGQLSEEEINEQKKRDEAAIVALIDAAMDAQRRFAEDLENAAKFWDDYASPEQKQRLSAQFSIISDPNASPEAQQEAVVEATGTIAEVQAMNPDAPQDPDEFARVAVALAERRYVEEEAAKGNDAEAARAHFQQLIRDPETYALVIQRAKEVQAAHDEIGVARAANAHIADLAAREVSLRSQADALVIAGQIHEEMVTALPEGGQIDYDAYQATLRERLGDETFNSLKETYVTSVAETLDRTAEASKSLFDQAFEGVSSFISSFSESTETEREAAYQEQIERLSTLQEQRDALKVDAQNPALAPYLRAEIAELDKEITTISDTLRNDLHNELNGANTWHQKELDAISAQNAMDPDGTGAGMDFGIGGAMDLASPLAIPGAMVNDAAAEVDQYKALLASLDNVMGVEASTMDIIQRSFDGRTSISHWELQEALKDQGFEGEALESETNAVIQSLQESGNLPVTHIPGSEEAPAPAPQPEMSLQEKVLMAFLADRVDAREVETMIRDLGGSDISDARVMEIKSEVLAEMEASGQIIDARYADPVTGLVSGKPALGMGLAENDPAKGTLSATFGGGAAQPAPAAEPTPAPDMALANNTRIMQAGVPV